MHRMLAAAAALLAATLPALAGDERPPITDDERRALFAWADGLGLPSLKEMPFVRFTQGYATTVEPGPVKAYEHFGFLAKDDGSAFEVLSLSRARVPLRRSPAGTPAPKVVGFGKADLADAVRARLAEKEQSGPETMRWYLGMDRLTIRVDLFLLARLCEERGLSQFVEPALRKANETLWNEEFEENAPLRVLLERDFARADFSAIVQSFEHPPASRSSLAADFRRVAERFPGSPLAPRARAMAEVLERMAPEDEAHRPPEGFPEACPREDAIREWAWRLRDETRLPTLSGGGTTIYFRPDLHPGSPAHALASIGTAAVPALLAALDDPRPTRAVAGDDIRFDPFPEQVHAIGAVAKQSLEWIAGREFRGRADAEAWWGKAKEKGYAAVLAEGVRRGDSDSDRQADLLVDKFPAEALGPVVEGARRATDPSTRFGLVKAAGRIPGDGCVAFLLEELEEGPLLAGRVAAAISLRARGRTEALRAMLREWKANVDPLCPADLLQFLLRTGEAEPVRALAEGLAARPLQWRLWVAMEAWLHAESPPDRMPRSPQFRGAVQDLLAGLLEDREPLPGSMSVLGVSLEESRLCDLAGTGLARIRGTPRAFDPAAPLADRDRALAALRDAWRAERGQGGR